MLRGVCSLCDDYIADAFWVLLVVFIFRFAL